jgi:hypothetical protein
MLVFSCAYERIADEKPFVTPPDTPVLTLGVTAVR